ncbi:virion structural protein [Escherichia phage EcS1]|uniref:Small outer capsid protein n=1 Tax=Escherichia phage EcS1 TaxID=2083276 RepID=A0A2Z5ZCF5_9CAUD|nr:virion structural protein [Escherichia phage EcS1]BBC78072.1 Small outer capsid protein [Escherichia phage EcS1]
MNYVNIKTKDRAVKDGTIKGQEVSIAFSVYSTAHQIAGTQYHLSLSDTALYTTNKFEDGQLDAWITFNKKLFEVTPNP